MKNQASILPLPMPAPVVDMLSPEEADVVNLIANGIVEQSIKQAYEASENSHTVYPHINRQAEQLQHRRTG